MQALATLREAPVIVLVGGHERGLEWTPLADHVARNPPKAIITMGANGPRIARALQQVESKCRLFEATTLADAVSAARSLAASGDTILLSPGAPSFDQFKDYAERGRVFAMLAGCAVGADAIIGLGIS